MLKHIGLLGSKRIFQHPKTGAAFLEGSAEYLRYMATQVAESPTSKDLPAVLKEPRPVKLAASNTCLVKESNPDYTEICAAYESATAILRLSCFRPTPSNRLKWKHWSMHHKERVADTRALNDAHWVIPIGGSIPQEATTMHELTIVQYGGRMQDTINYAQSCKGLIDELVVRKLLVDDSRQWLKAQYYQQAGGAKQLDILF